MTRPPAAGRLVILSGPSCVGKSPLANAMGRFYPEQRQTLQRMVLYNSRPPRPGEVDGVDYHFRPRPEIEAFRGREDVVVLDVRGDLHALHLSQLKNLLQRGEVLYEGNPYVGRLLQTHPSLASVRRLAVFLSPLSREEICYLKDPERRVLLSEFVTDLMRRKLLRRTQRQKGILSLPDLQNIEKRAASAYQELQEAWHFDFVLPNHDGEDSDHWTAFPCLLGDARKVLLDFVALLEGNIPAGAERWEENLLA